jgi:MFS family permease
MPAAASPFSITNIRLFIAFRIFFNARFYYPVFTILFLDFGLTIEQFALLNTVWAITIVCAEVPSGALADILGRKYLLVTTSLLMVVEMSLLAFVPLGNSSLIFLVFLINRVLSGLAEAMASGADEAIAYDTLATEGNPDHWPKVLSLQMRLRSIGTIVTMTTGALIYDPNMVNRFLAWIGSSLVVDQQTTMRFPIYLTLVLAILATITALRMEEKKKEDTNGVSFRTIAALKMTWQAGAWIARTPFAMAIILFGMCYDHILRMIVTMNSQYYRQIDLPEASFGVIGSGIALLGLLIPKIAEYMVEKNSPTANMLWVAAISLVGLFGLTGFFSLLGAAAYGLDLCRHDVCLLFHQPLSQSHNRIAPAGDRAQFQGHGLQSRLWPDRLSLCPAHHPPANGRDSAPTDMVTLGHRESGLCSRHLLVSLVYHHLPRLDHALLFAPATRTTSCGNCYGACIEHDEHL